MFMVFYYLKFIFFSLENEEDDPIEFESNSSLVVETDDDLLEIQSDTAESAAIGSELDTVD